MRTFEEPTSVAADEWHAEFEVTSGGESVDARGSNADDVQVTVVLRGSREELEDPTRNVTALVLRVLETQRAGCRDAEVIDVAGVTVAAAGPG